jgi:alkanesulfonate monooxygenase SsuD/methylene tetrahydromethanopterin reductase-like flavin-dependent oxidoreductase (luciferase family)
VFVGITCGGEFWGLDAFARVEELGFDGLFTGEHLLFHRPVWDAVTMCTAMACATERIAIGPAATIAPLRHPTLLAKEFAGVDRISGGRLVLTLGVGGDSEKELTAAGVPFERLGRRTTEALEILRRYFSGERFSYDGEIYHLDDVWIDPPPSRPGGPPLWVAGRRAASLRRAALLGDGFLPYMVTPERCLHMFDVVRADAERAGRDLAPGFAWGAFVYLCLDRDEAAARRRGDEHLAWRYDEPRFRADLAGKYVVAGGPQACVEGLLRFAEAGCTHLVLSVIRPEGEPPLRSLEAVAGALLPELRRLARPLDEDATLPDGA